MIKKILTPLVFILLSISGISQTTYNVTSPSDMVSQFVVGGDTVILADGVYSGVDIMLTRSGSTGNFITYKSETPGGVKFIGATTFNVNGSYVKLEGFDFGDPNATTTPRSGTSERVMRLYKGNITLEGVRMRNITNRSGATRTDYILASNQTDIVIKECWFEKPATIGRILALECTSTSIVLNPTIENCYFKQDRYTAGYSDGVEAIRIGSGEIAGDITSNGNIRNNLFEGSNGEDEIVSLKSSGTTVSGNTFRNCYGALSFRHYGSNIAENNYFINTDAYNSNNDQGGGIVVWGENHIIRNNYFHKIKSRTGEHGGVITLIAGNGTANNVKHQAVKNLTIEKNIIYEAQAYSGIKLNYGISFGTRYNTSLGRTIMPSNVTLTNNRIYSSVTTREQIKYQDGTPTNVSFNGNKIFTVAGDGVPSAQNVNPVVTSSGNGIYRDYADTTIGPPHHTNPLESNQVGPIWARPIVAVTSIALSSNNLSLVNGANATLTTTISPSNATDTSVFWTSSNTAIATVDYNTGVVSATGVGSATITATSNSNNSIIGTCTVSVTTPSQGITYGETFENLSVVNLVDGDWVNTGGGETFTGDNKTWLLVNCKKVQNSRAITNKGVYVNKNTLGFKSVGIIDGISTFSFQCRSEWLETTARKVEVRFHVVGSSSAGDVVKTHNFTSGAIQYVSYPNINLQGEVEISIKNATPSSETGGCSVTFDNISWTNNVTLGMRDDILKESLKVYPNPTQGVFYIVSKDIKIKKSVQVINTLGQQVAELRINAQNSIDISSLRSGVYFVKIQDLHGATSLKKMIVR